MAFCHGFLDAFLEPVWTFFQICVEFFGVEALADFVQRGGVEGFFEVEKVDECFFDVGHVDEEVGVGFGLVTEEKPAVDAPDEVVVVEELPQSGADFAGRDHDGVGFLIPKAVLRQRVLESVIVGRVSGADELHFLLERVCSRRDTEYLVFSSQAVEHLAGVCARQPVFGKIKFDVAQGERRGFGKVFLQVLHVLHVQRLLSAWMIWSNVGTAPL